MPTNPQPKKVTGPASYFPSIEKTYGKPIADWKTLIRESPLTGHMELVNWLKCEHGLGHGHANALVGHTLAEDKQYARLTREHARNAHTMPAHTLQPARRISQ